MERAEQVDVAINRIGRTYGRYGWVILLTSALLGIFGAVLTAVPPENIRSSPFFEIAFPIMTALSLASAGFYIFATIMVFIPYRRGERWAWYTLWMLPLMWIAQFALLREPYYLVLAIITALGLVLPYRRFFSSQ